MEYLDKRIELIADLIVEIRVLIISEFGPRSCDLIKHIGTRKIDSEKVDISVKHDLNIPKMLLLHNRISALQACIKYLQSKKYNKEELKSDLDDLKSTNNNGQGYDRNYFIWESVTNKLINKTINFSNTKSEKTLQKLA